MYEPPDKKNSNPVKHGTYFKLLNRLGATYDCNPERKVTSYCFDLSAHIVTSLLHTLLHLSCKRHYFIFVPHTIYLAQDWHFLRIMSHLVTHGFSSFRKISQICDTKAISPLVCQHCFMLYCKVFSIDSKISTEWLPESIKELLLRLRV